MSAIQDLIDAYIRRNGVGAITGPVLHGVLTPIAQKLDTIPYKTSELENDAAFITNTVNDLLNYYTKGESYTKDQIDQIIASLRQFSYVVVDELPEASEDTMWKIYLVPSGLPAQENVKDEWITIETGGVYSWEQIGRTTVDLSDYSTTAEMNQAINDALAAYITGITATVDSNVGTPSVTVTFQNGTLNLAFHNMKGEQGEQGEQGIRGPEGIQGPQGNPGSSVDYPFTLANNLTTNDSTVALTAAMGVFIKGLLDEGYIYAGVATVATDPGTPSGKVFYIASAPGTYTYFGSPALVVADGEVAIFKYNGTWSKDVTGAATHAEVSQLGQETYKAIGGNYPLTMALEQGAISSTTGAETDNATRIRTADFIKANSIAITTSGNKVYVMGYLDDGTFVSAQGWITTNTTVTISGAKKYRLVFAKSDDSNITPTDFASLGISVTGEYDGTLAPKSEEFDSFKRTTINSFGLYSQIVLSPDILVTKGKYIFNGSIHDGANFGYSDLIQITKGTRLQASGIGNYIAAFVFCNSSGDYLSSPTPVSSASVIFTYTFTTDCYIKVQGRLNKDANGNVFCGIIYNGALLKDVTPSVYRYISTRGAIFVKSVWNNVTTINVTINTLLAFPSASAESITINDDTVYELSSTGHKFLVLTSDLNIVSRSNSSALLPSDTVLLFFDYTKNDITAGMLYADYEAHILGSLTRRTLLYAATRGANYVKGGNYVDITINTLLLYNEADISPLTVTDATTYRLQEGFVFLVLQADNTLAIRKASRYIINGDIVLLYYDYIGGDIKGGVLYADYLRTQNFMLPDNLGQVNCVKKAKQMATFKWTPKVAGTIPYNSGTFPASEQEGMIYSSVKEYSQFVFEDVSLETFMTAVNNVRSVLYTENVSAADSQSDLGRTYHGINCAAYYGSVCSGLLTFAYGLPMNVTTYEFRNWDRMEVIQDQTPYGLKIGDAIWESGHIQLATGITKDKYGVITNIEIVENAAATTQVKNWTVATLQTYMANHDCVILRYKDLYANRNYTPLTDFVAVMGETLGSYTYNDNICPNYGDKSNYNVGDDVVLNLRTDYASAGYTTLEVYKNNTLLISRAISGQDETLTGLAYGDYKARIVGSDSLASEYVYFKVVDAQITKSGDSFSFSSANATPLYYEFCDQEGRRSYDIVGLSTHTFTSAELSSGEATPSGAVVSTENHHYLKVHFQTDYGRVIKVIDWNS